MLTYEELVDKERLEAVAADSLTELDKQRLSLLEAKGPARIMAFLRDDLLIWMVCLVVVILNCNCIMQSTFYLPVLWLHRLPL